MLVKKFILVIQSLMVSLNFKLKTKDNDTDGCESCKSFQFDYEMVREICKTGSKIPLLSLQQAYDLLRSLKPSVCDHWSVSAAHYLHGGSSALKHFHFIINAAIEDISNVECDEINTAHACVLYKGHKKDKKKAISYRTISNCPFISNALDVYVRGLSIAEWDSARADVQFLGPGTLSNQNNNIFN